MSYDYIFFRLRKTISSHRDLSEETLQLLGPGDDIKTALSALFPDTEWEESEGTLWGSLRHRRSRRSAHR
jgi:hypothetical protein